MSPEGAEIRSSSKHHPPGPNSRHSTEHPEPRCGDQGPRPARQGQRPALKQRADRRQHLERRTVEILDQDPGAGGGGASQRPRPPGELPWHVGAGVSAQEGLAVGLVVQV